MLSGILRIAPINILRRWRPIVQWFWTMQRESDCYALIDRTAYGKKESLIYPTEQEPDVLGSFCVTILECECDTRTRPKVVLGVGITPKRIVAAHDVVHASPYGDVSCHWNLYSTTNGHGKPVLGG